MVSTHPPARSAPRLPVPPADTTRSLPATSEKKPSCDRERRTERRRRSPAPPATDSAAPRSTLQPSPPAKPLPQSGRPAEFSAASSTPASPSHLLPSQGFADHATRAHAHHNPHVPHPAGDGRATFNQHHRAASLGNTNGLAPNHFSVSPSEFQLPAAALTARRAGLLSTVRHQSQRIVQRIGRTVNRSPSARSDCAGTVRASEIAAAASLGRSMAGDGIGTSAPSASFKNVSPNSPPCQSIEITSPSDTCSVASKLASGYTTCRSIARFKCRAPYFMSVPSFSKNSRAGCVTRNKNRPFAVSSTRCCTIPSSISRINSSCAERSGRNTTVLSIRFMNSGANFLFAASDAVFSTFSSNPNFVSVRCTGANPNPPVISSVISTPPKFDVMKIIVCDKSTRRLSPSVKVALSKIPNSNCHKASEAFSISSNSKNEIFSFSVWYCARASCVIKGCVSRCPKYPGGEPINFAISCECWNSAQSTLITARGSPNSTSAVASTTRVFPAPVGPKNSKFPTGRPGEFNPARNTWYKSTTACTASSCPTIFRRSPASKSRDSTLRWVGSSCSACAPTFCSLPELSAAFRIARFRSLELIQLHIER